MVVIMHSLNSVPDFSFLSGFLGNTIFCPMVYKPLFYYIPGPFVLLITAISPTICYWITAYGADLYNFGRNQHKDSSHPNVALINYTDLLLG